MSEKLIAQQQAGFVRRRTLADQTPLISLGHALMANSLWRGQEKRMMREREVQIGNPGFIDADDKFLFFPELGLAIDTSDGIKVSKLIVTRIPID